MDRKKAEEFQKERAIPEERLLFRGTQWLCTDCRFVLGYINPQKTEVRMKAKDFFLTVEGGKITHPCRRCGKTNEIAEEEYLAWKAEKKSFDEFLANRKLFQEFLANRTEFKKFLIPSKKKKKEEEK
ncbi:unnamed protein product [marine sediment metagenome]|uniref:Uncharacterized protein n=1 Tax=marine sediment metagenome TaxID=412755 RepID=X1ERN0_9ZZZZ